MTRDRGSERHAQIQALHEAARRERAQTLRQLWQRLLRRLGAADNAWEPPGKPALADCG
jgi:hypothetical protein